MTLHLVGEILGEPEVAVRAGDDADGLAIRCRDGELGDRSRGRDPADLVSDFLGEFHLADTSGPTLTSDLVSIAAVYVNDNRAYRALRCNSDLNTKLAGTLQ